MDLRQLRYFVAAADAGSISRAASRLRIAQPSLSQQIRRLEEQVGRPLFDRLGRGVVLTEPGAALLPHARRILAQVEDLEATLRSSDVDGPGRLALGAIPTMAPYLVPPLLARIRRAHPACEVVIREDLTQNLVEAVADTELDLAITSTPIVNDSVEVEVIGREPMLVVAPAAHPFASDDGVALPALRDQPAVTLHEMHCLGRQVDEFCAARRIASNVVCRMTQVETLLEFVRLGLGVSIMPRMVATHDRSAGRVYLPFLRSPPMREIALVWRRGRSRSSVAQECAEALRAQVKEAR